MPGGGIDVVQGLTAPGLVEVDGAEQLGEADDRLDRRASLVTDRGQQLRPGVGEVLGGPPCRLRLQLRPPVVLGGPTLGQVEELWDEVAIAMYPNRRAMVEMSTSSEWRGISVHREAGLKGQLNIETVLQESDWGGAQLLK